MTEIFELLVIAIPISGAVMVFHVKRHMRSKATDRFVESEMQRLRRIRTRRRFVERKRIGCDGRVWKWTDVISEMG